MKEITSALATIQEPGSFCAQQTVLVEALSLRVKGLGLLKWPLTDKTIQQVIALAKPARFGWRDQTVLDRNVRDVWEISAEKIEIDEKIWRNTLYSVLDALSTDLGLPNKTRLKASLHNLLIYEPGQFFRPHQDSEKQNGVATMVVVLPCTHTGGELIIDHQGIKQTFQSSRFSLDELTFITFYADCHHEMKPLKSGYRMALTYNLILENSNKTADDIHSTFANNRIANALHDYFAEEPSSKGANYRPRKCVYLLDHQYTQKGLSWEHLKNVDRIRVAALKQAADHLNLDIYLALADIQETWNCEPDFDDYRDGWHSRRYGYDDEEETVVEYREKHIELVELIENNISLQHWLNRENKELYPVLDLIPVLNECESAVYEKLLRYIFSGLQQEKNTGLRQPNDWSISEKMACSCTDCVVLGQFLRSQTETTKIWPLAKDRRAHIHQIIDSLGIPVTHETQHTGSPHKLILTKTELLHSEAKKRFTQISKELSRLTKRLQECA